MKNFIKKIIAVLVDLFILLFVFYYFGWYLLYLFPFSSTDGPVAALFMMGIFILIFPPVIIMAYFYTLKKFLKIRTIGEFLMFTPIVANQQSDKNSPNIISS